MRCCKSTMWFVKWVLKMIEIQVWKNWQLLLHCIVEEWENVLIID